MSNRAKDTNITLENDIATILREHTRNSCCTPDEWCNKCGEWPCPSVYIATEFQKLLDGEAIEINKYNSIFLGEVVDNGEVEKVNVKLVVTDQFPSNIGRW